MEPGDLREASSLMLGVFSFLEALIMAATPITPVEPSAAGIAPMTAVAADAVNGNSVPNSGGLHLIFENTDAAPQTVTFTTPARVGGYSVEDPVVSVPAGATRHCARFGVGAFSGTLTFTASSALVMVSAYVVQ